MSTTTFGREIQGKVSRKVSETYQKISNKGSIMSYEQISKISLNITFFII